MIQRITGQFRQSPNNAPPSLNTIDTITEFAVFTSARTPGAAVVDRIVASPDLNQQWSLLAFSVTAYMLVLTTNAIFGKLGKVLTGVTRGNVATITGSLNGPYAPNVPPPTDTTLLTPLFDPATDPLPPVTAFNPASFLGGFRSATLQLPQPIDLNPGEDIALGIWQLPSLVGFSSIVGSATCAVGIFLGAYALVYDDGR